MAPKYGRLSESHTFWVDLKNNNKLKVKLVQVRNREAKQTFSLSIYSCLTMSRLWAVQWCFQWRWKGQSCTPLWSWKSMFSLLYQVKKSFAISVKWKQAYPSLQSTCVRSERAPFGPNRAHPSPEGYSIARRTIQGRTGVLRKHRDKKWSAFFLGRVSQGGET